MIEVHLPGRNRTLRLGCLLLDINGTLTVDGELINGVADRIEALKKNWPSIYYRPTPMAEPRPRLTPWDWNSFG